MSKLSSNLKLILDRMSRASSKRSESLQYFQPRLVAVSKLKSVQDIIEVYKNGQIYFGENYVNELVAKSNDEKIISQCPNIKWHFIGNLQSNKISKILSCPNLFMIETVDSVPLANKLDRSLKDKTLNVMIQVNTSSEKQKNGIDLNSAITLYKHILDNCKNIRIKGLMTIGSLDSSLNKDDLNQDFQNLVKCREIISKELKIDLKSIELSMGMSNDFETAIVMGSSSVRIGSSIFGTRN